jgi:UDP-N-acetylglucosamine 2-epimerase
LKVPLLDLKTQHKTIREEIRQTLEEVLVVGSSQRETLDWIVVYGDTNSLLAGASAAVKVHIPVARVEVALRSFNRRMPKEIYRTVTDHFSNLLS